MTVISRMFTTKNQIAGGKVLVKWRGDNIDEIEEKLKKALKAVQSSRTESDWIPSAEYQISDAKEAERKLKNKRPRTVFSMRMG